MAEQQSPDLFNLSLSRNVAAWATLDDGESGFFVFYDVDIIPLRDVDYGPRSFNVAWFLSAGSQPILSEPTGTPRTPWAGATRTWSSITAWSMSAARSKGGTGHQNAGRRSAQMSNGRRCPTKRHFRGLNATSGTRPPGLGSSPIGATVAASNGTINRATSLHQVSRSAITCCGTGYACCLAYIARNGLNRVRVDARFNQLGVEFYGSNTKRWTG